MPNLAIGRGKNTVSLKPFADCLQTLACQVFGKNTPYNGSFLIVNDEFAISSLSKPWISCATELLFRVGADPAVSTDPLLCCLSSPRITCIGFAGITETTLLIHFSSFYCNPWIPRSKYEKIYLSEIIIISHKHFDYFNIFSCLAT